jgi:uncharacterized protein (DUF1697 family)
MAKPSNCHVALLRGVNVGGARRLPMAELRELFTDAGAQEVATCIQSGNVVFATGAVGAASTSEAERIAAAVAEALAARFDGAVPVVLRSAAQWDAAVAAMPFELDVDTPKHFCIGFLDRTPPREASAAADPDPFPPDRWVLDGREVYAHYPNGAARSKLTIGWLEKALGVRCTMRNWNTVLRLQAMTRS